MVYTSNPQREQGRCIHEQHLFTKKDTEEVVAGQLQLAGPSLGVVQPEIWCHFLSKVQADILCQKVVCFLEDGLR
jgi:hypothetical protein